MAFERFEQLGEEKFGRIVNALMRGQPAMNLAREMQLQPPKGWGEFQDVAEKTLTQQLNRLRLVIAEGAFGKKAAQALAKGHIQVLAKHVKGLENVSPSVLQRMEEVGNAQRTLVLVLLEKATQEKRTFQSVNDAVEGYRKILFDIQKLRFDLGLDEFKGPMTTIKGASQTTTYPDGMSVQKQVFEAVTTLEKIFEARNIPRLR